MPLALIQRIANKYDVDIQLSAMDRFTIRDIFLDELSKEDIINLLAEYGDAGKVSSFFFVSKGRIPSNSILMERSRAIMDLKPESYMWENYPYFDEIGINHLTQTFRIYFHYLKGSYHMMDVETKTIREQRRVHYGLIIYRPERSILEVRTKYGSMAKKVVSWTTEFLGIEPFHPLNLLERTLIERVIEWISSLNNARIELPLTDASSSLIITARKGRDLRTVKRFQEARREGKLRGGHVTMIKDNKRQINFNIYFRGCHISFTSFCNEYDIEFVADALEKIVEGYEFAPPGRLLEFLGKKS